MNQYLPVKLLFQPIPARGRKRCADGNRADLLHISTYPRKGTITRGCQPPRQGDSISTYPRKGTETRRTSSTGSTWFYFNLSPQGDGNASQRRSVGTNRLNFNLSPQGDGNSLTKLMACGVQLFQLIPARGRKRRMLYQLRQMPSISTYPRKGTETLFLLFLHVYNIFQLIPARGRKLDIVDDALDLVISTYPRKGTETQ